jgi:hypothetical protein
MIRAAVAPNIIDAFTRPVLTKNAPGGSLSFSSTIEGHSTDNLRFSIPVTVLLCEDATKHEYILSPESAQALKNAILESVSFGRTLKSIKNDGKLVKSWQFPGPANNNARPPEH